MAPRLMVVGISTNTTTPTTAVPAQTSSPSSEPPRLLATVLTIQLPQQHLAVVVAAAPAHRKSHCQTTSITPKSSRNPQQRRQRVRWI